MPCFCHTVTQVLWGSWGKLRVLLAGSAHFSNKKMHFYPTDISNSALLLFGNTLQCLPSLHRKNPGVTQLPNRRRQLLFQQQLFSQCSVPVATISQNSFPRAFVYRVIHEVGRAGSQPLECCKFLCAKVWPYKPQTDQQNFHVCFALNTPQKGFYADCLKEPTTFTTC